MAKDKQYFSSLQELQQPEQIEELFSGEFAVAENPEAETTETSRRDFLKWVGFGTVAASLAACETPVYKAIPYVVKPEETIAGIANYYASSFYDGHDFASVLVKTREGRPIAYRSNVDAPYGGSANARVLGSVLSLYDSNRIKGPHKGEESLSWNSAVSEVKAKLASVGSKTIALLTNTVISPTAHSAIEQMKAKFPTLQTYTVDVRDFSGIRKAHKGVFGKAVLPRLRFDKAQIIVSFGADFLQDFIEGEYSSQYASMRKPDEGKMSKHYQFESNLSVTGSNADYRFPIKPSEEGAYLVHLYKILMHKMGTGAKPTLNAKYQSAVEGIANDLINNQGQSLVVSGSNLPEVQTLVALINKALGNYGATLDIDMPLNMHQGSHAQWMTLQKDILSGKVGALLIQGLNPVYQMSNGDEFAKMLSKVPTTISFDSTPNETNALCQYILPDTHCLESWGDAEPVMGVRTILQPTIAPIFDGKEWYSTLSHLSGEGKDAYQLLQEALEKDGVTNFEQVVHDGFVVSTQSALTAVEDAVESEVISSEDILQIQDISALESWSLKQLNDSQNFELALYTKTGIGIGNGIDNPWLQELPDPISKTTWDNYLTISPLDADPKRNGTGNNLMNYTTPKGGINGARVSLKVGDTLLENVPVLVQPGQAKGTLGLALGYGRTVASKTGKDVGVNAFPLYMNGCSTLNNATIEMIGEAESDGYPFAVTQIASTAMDRKEVVKETTFDTFLKDPKAGNEAMLLETHKGKQHVEKITLWEEFERDVHHWNLSVDLTNCTGCGACVVACHAENNVPVVGKEEIRNGRDMHWLRIDRYYSSAMTKERAAADPEMDGLGGVIDMYLEMEVAADEPEVIFQPVMCQHCNHAPCENVCPVGATAHSREGLNHMAYNRCIGTRYCANNCPYKVRRFNWFQYSDNNEFDFHMNDSYGKMVLNPDVTVRSRGVMEKCSMCVHMIQRSKLDAKKAGRKVRDEDAQTACSIACETGALTFGDVLDKNHEVFKLKKNARAYHMLEQLNTQPSVVYQMKVRNN